RARALTAMHADRAAGAHRLRVRTSQHAVNTAGGRH
ncbi:GntR family transcriptional regulator, partial [Streptomyces sp. SID7760]|nr:GntR family transcriptional regulator [Streptomyces sp. SID7760]